VPKQPLVDPAVATAQRLGALLVERRHAAGLSQEQVAVVAGISRNHLQLLEAGLSNRSGAPANPRLSTLIALAEALGTDVMALVGEVFGGE
jgi:transcriptional regulator with XRE-family HTH domain